MPYLAPATQGTNGGLMTKLVTLLIALILTSMAQGKDVNATYIKGYDFSVRDVQRYCTANRGNGDNLTIQCKDKRLKPVSQSCEGWITGGLDFAKLSCGGGLWILNNKCKIEMIGASRGNVNCVF